MAPKLSMAAKYPSAVFAEQSSGHSDSKEADGSDVEGDQPFRDKLAEEKAKQDKVPERRRLL